MNWIERMNMVIEYIEDNLTEEISLEKISMLSCCSVYNFQRIFSFLFNMPLSEYIRGRRLTEAAEELWGNDLKIIDIAIKYQYESHEAFSRAFIKFHGISPSAAKKQANKLFVCPRANLEQVYRRENKMNEQTLLLQRNQSTQLFYKGVKGPGTLPTAMSMWSYLEFLGVAQEAQQTYTILSSLCGELYSPPVSMPLPSGVKRMLEIMGFEYEIFTVQDLDKSAMKQRIVEHLSTIGQPVIVTTESGDWCFGGTVIGYENGGETLVNWGYFPFDDSIDPQPILSKNDIWYSDNTVLMIIGKRIALSDLVNVYRAGIKAAYDDLSVNYLNANQKFYADWKRILTQPITQTIKEVKQTRKIPCTWGILQEDELIDSVIEKRMLEIVDPLWCDYAERRFYAARFLQQAANYLPNAKDCISGAQAEFDRIHNRMSEYIAKVDLVPGAEFFNHDKFSNPKIRGEMAEIVEQCRLDEKTAIQHLKDAVALL